MNYAPEVASEVVIRPALEDDAPEINKLLIERTPDILSLDDPGYINEVIQRRAATGEERVRSLIRETQLTQPFSGDTLARYLKVATLGGAVVGYAHAEASRGHVWWRGKAAAPGLDGRGIGQRLEADRQRWAMPRRQTVRVEVVQENARSQDFLFRQGFDVVGSTVEPNGRFKLVVMELGLRSLRNNVLVEAPLAGLCDPVSADTYADEILERSRLATPNQTILHRLGQVGQAMMVVGFEPHTNNPASPAFQNAADAYGRWLYSTRKTPEARVGIIEGGFARRPILPDVPMAHILKQYGEQTAFYNALMRDGISEFISAEPQNHENIHTAHAVLTTELIEGGLAPQAAAQKAVETAVLFLGMRYSRQLYQQGKITDEVADFIDQRLRADSAELAALPGSAFTDREQMFHFEAFNQLYEATYGRPYDIANWQFDLDETVERIYHPERFTEGSLVGRFACLSDSVRNENWKNLLMELWRSGKSPFAPMGQPHVSFLEDAIRRCGRADLTFGDVKFCSVEEISKLANVAAEIYPDDYRFEPIAQEMWEERFKNTYPPVPLPGSPNTRQIYSEDYALSPVDYEVPRHAWRLTSL